MGRRHQQLEDSLKLHEYIHDIEDEMAWIREREPLANNNALGNSLTSVQSLLKRHQVREGREGEGGREGGRGEREEGKGEGERGESGNDRIEGNEGGKNRGREGGREEGGRGRIEG